MTTIDFLIENSRWKLRNESVYCIEESSCIRFHQDRNHNLYKFHDTIMETNLNGKYILLTCTQRGNIQIIEHLQTVTFDRNLISQSALYILGIHYKVASESLMGCVETSIKLPFYGAHACFYNPSDQF